MGESNLSLVSGFSKAIEPGYLFDVFLSALPHRDDALRVSLKLSEELTRDAALPIKIDIAKLICTILRDYSVSNAQSKSSELGEVIARVINFTIGCIDDSATLDTKTALAKVIGIYAPIGDAINTVLITSVLTSVEASLNEREDLAVKLDISRDVWIALKHSSHSSHVDSGRPELYECLKFMSILYQQPSLLPAALSSLLSSLLVLVGSSNKITARAAKETILATVTNIPDHPSPPEELKGVHEFVWKRLRELCMFKGDKIYQESAQSILLRMISVDSIPFPTRELLHSEEYWEILHETLRTGTHEGRKFSLAIIGISIGQLQDYFDNNYQSFNPEKAGIITTDLLKFCTIYHTIILGRYVNQAQACLPDLGQLSRLDSPLHKAWVVSLFFATLGNAMQDSIRRLSGMWILKNAAPILQRVPSSIPDLLEHYLLPWASEGQHYTTQREVNEHGHTICTQGKQLSSFISELIFLSSAAEERSEIIRAVLHFLIKSTPRTYSFPRVYILEGLLSGFKRASPILEPDMIASIEKLSSASHFHELANDYMVFLCKDMLAFGEPSGSKQSQLLHETCLKLATHPPSLSDKESFVGSVQYFTSLGITGNEDKEPTTSTALSKLTSWISTSRTECLKGNGLQAAYDILRYALDNTELATEDGNCLNFIVRSLWDEVEIQDYPRKILMQLPEIILHPICLVQSLSDSTLHSIVLDIAQQIQIFSENRIYLLPPFARSLRRAIMNTSETHGQLFINSLVRYANHPPFTRVEFHLLYELGGKLQKYVPWRDYRYYYGDLQGIGHATIFDLLNQLPATYKSQAKEIIDTILEPWLKQKRPPPVFSPWKRSSQLQVIVILMEYLAPSLSIEEVDVYFEKLFDMIATEPLPLLRYLFEWIVVRMCQRCQRQSQMLEMLAVADITNPKYVVSVIKISLTLADTPDTTEEFGFELMLQLFTQCAGAKIAIRHEAQWSVPILWDYAFKRNWTTILLNPAFVRLNNFIRSMDAYKNPPPERLPEVFNILDHHHLTHLVEGDYHNIEPMEMPRLRREDFLEIWRDDRGGQSGRPTNPTEPRSPGIMLLGEKIPVKAAAVKAAVKEIRAGGSTFSVSVPLQIKSQQFTDLISLGPNSSSSIQKRPVILLASLIDNFHNLGGLSRISEIFGLSSMLVRSTRVQQTKEFQAVSVSSEKHLPIAQLAIDDIPVYLSARKGEGYTVVGVEQTDSSRVLGEGEWKFDEKVILIMGSEKEGIPARVLQECDYCIVVKQKGVTRSMNVQTAAAVAMYEYARQRPSV